MPPLRQFRRQSADKSANNDTPARPLWTRSFLATAGQTRRRRGRRECDLRELLREASARPSPPLVLVGHQTAREAAPSHGFSAAPRPSANNLAATSFTTRAGVVCMSRKTSPASLSISRPGRARCSRRSWILGLGDQKWCGSGDLAADQPLIVRVQRSDRQNVVVDNCRLESNGLAGSPVAVRTEACAPGPARRCKSRGNNEVDRNVNAPALDLDCLNPRAGFFCSARSPGVVESFAHYVCLSLIHISEPTRRTPISYAVFCLKK